MKQYDKTHGSPYDRGGADSYYGRPALPHKGGSGGEGGWTKIYDLTPEERAAYFAGYADNEECGAKKDWN